ncbi:MAG: hypothetical protein R6U64_02770 [Bacteroidales bacterium]
MKRIILYRYHENLALCIDRLTLIRGLNPGVPVYGLYGGPDHECEKFSTPLSHLLDGIYCIRNKSGYWKWGNSDLAFRLWYQDYGHRLDFDSVIVLEWDLVLFEPIEKLYAHIQPGQVGMTGLTPLSNVEKKWFWTRDPSRREEWLKLLEHVTRYHHYDQAPYASLCPGVIMPKAFLEAYNAIEIPELAHDELRLPLYAQVLGFELADLGFYKKWFSAQEWSLFNCNDLPISAAIIEKELAKSNGRKVFHPFREMISERFSNLIPSRNQSF